MLLRVYYQKLQVNLLSSAPIVLSLAYWTHRVGITWRQGWNSTSQVLLKAPMILQISQWIFHPSASPICGAKRAGNFLWRFEHLQSVWDSWAKAKKSKAREIHSHLYVFIIALIMEGILLESLSLFISLASTRVQLNEKLQAMRREIHFVAFEVQLEGKRTMSSGWSETSVLEVWREELKILLALWMANECSDACRMTEIIERVHFPVCSRNPTREDPARLSSGNCDDNVQPFGGERRSRDQLVHRQGPGAPTQRNVHHRHGLLWNRKQPGHSKAAPRRRKYLIKFKFLRRAFACIWPSAFPTF